ncbi:MAG: MG2 domain-containing protein, partial [Solirubrobacterales bacterium]
MLGLSRRSVVVGFFAIINVAGLVWIHHDLTQAPRATVRVLAASLLPDADSPDRLEFTFDRNLIADSAIGRTEENAVFSLTPACPGKWTWSAADRLQYLLEKPLPAGCMLELAATDRFKAATGRILEGQAQFKLAARPLRLASCEVTAADQSDITLHATFNQPVDPGDFLRHAAFYDAETSTRLDEPKCLTTTAQNDLVIRFHRPQSNSFRMVLDADLAGYAADVGLGQSVEIERTVEPGFTLLHSYVEMPEVSDVIAVRFFFSQGLRSDQPLPQLVAEPPVEDLDAHISENALVVTGKFTAGRRYVIRTPGTILSEEGKTLGQDTPVVVQIPDYEPKIRFDQQQGFLSPSGQLAVDAKGVNLDQLDIQVWRVHANNLVPHLHWTQADETSRSILDKKIAMKQPRNKPAKLVLGLQELLSQPLGIYRVQAWATDHRWTQDTTLVTVTDLAITAKRHRDGYTVWVTSLRTARPASGVEISGLTYNNQKVATATTDAEGIAELRFAGGHPDGGIWVITAAKDGDLSYVQPDENQWVIDDAEERGRPYGDHYETMLYTDRGVYRPGETIHLTGVIRDTTGQIPSLFPLSVKVDRPDGRRVADLTVTRREKDQGMFHASFTPSAEAQTGSYQFYVTLPGSEDSLGSTDALVEAFVPVRMEVTAEAASERFGPKATPAVTVNSRYLWDQPAADLPVQVEGTLLRESFDSKSHPDYEFGLDRRDAPIVLPTVDGQLDEQGGCDVQVQLPGNLKPALYRMRLAATVTEPGGRSVSANTSALVDRVDTHIGLR